MNGTYIFRGMVLPEDTKETIDNYIHHGIPTGGFLEAVINNRLFEAVGRADDHNLPVLPAIVAYFHNHAPFGCHGFDGAHGRWIQKKIEERKRKTEEQ